MQAQKLKNANLYNEGRSHLGEIAEITLPKIVMITSDWRPGGSLGPVPVDMGVEALSVEWTLGGWSSQVISQMGTLALDGVLLRAIGAFQAEDGGAVRIVEAVMMGRHTELDLGTWKVGEDTEKKVKSALTYYKLIVDNSELLEIDMLAGIYVVDGVDRYAEIRAAISG